MDAPPALKAPQSAAVVRVTVGLILFGLLELAGSIYGILLSFSFGGSFSLTAPLGCLILWFAAWLVWRGNATIWSVLAILTPAALGGLLGTLLAVGSMCPWKLITAFVQHETAWIGYALAYVLGGLLLLGWLTWESNRHPGTLTARGPWLRAPALMTYGALPTALLLMLILALIQGNWTHGAVELVRQQLGDDYDYWVHSWHQQSTNGQTTGHAVVLAYNDEEMRQVHVRW